MHPIASLALLLGIVSSAMPAAAQPSASAPPRYTAVSAQTREVAERYLQAYLRKDWGQLAPLMAEQIQFRDTTAPLVFGSLDQSGKPALLRYFGEVYAYIETHQFTLERSFFAGQQAVFVGQSDWSFAPPGQPVVRSRIPVVIALQVEDGRVSEHREMGDLQPYLDADAAARQPGAGRLKPMPAAAQPRP